MLKDNPEITANEVIEFVKLLHQHGIEVTIDGGWGVDALLGRQTRRHADLDIAVRHQDVAQIRALLEARNYQDVPRDDTRDCNFVLGDDQGHLIDIHVYEFDAAGKVTFGLDYAPDSLKGSGSINGFPVKCITPEWMVKFHTGYQLDENDYQDVKRLCQHFGIQLPSEYAEFALKDNQIPQESKNMKTITLRPAEPERDFGQLAAWFSILEDEPASEPSLKEEYERDRERILLKVAEAEQGELLGFYWAKRNKVEPDRFDMYLFVTPEQRGQGIGCRLYEALAQATEAAQAQTLRVSVWDTHPEDRIFAERRGFSEKRHHFAMALDLDAFDDRPYDEVIAGLKSEGFQFTSMEALGNTEDAQRKLYALNDAASITTLGSEGEHPWISFEDFQKSVCQSAWYKPGGQIVAIETATGEWAAMSAITRLEGNDYAYNLFTGVDERYRGRKLGQAVKVLALRYAREVLQAHTVRTHHNFKNLPMIAIDQKLGYTMQPGTFLMEKEL